MEQIPIKEPAEPPIVLRISSFGPLTLQWHNHHTSTTVSFPEEKLHGKGTAPAFSLLKLLISQPNRYASRDWILEQFWPETESSKAEGRMDDVSSYLRTLLSSPSGKKEPFLQYLRTSKQSGGGYRLAPYPLIWVDADAFEWFIEQAARLDRFGHDSLSLWEQAYQLASQGEFLPEERYSDWTSLRRERLDGQYRQCVHRLLYLLREAGAYEEALLRLRDYWQHHQTDEDALRVLVEMLGERERYQEAEGYYEQTRVALERDGRELDAKTRDVIELVRTLQIQRKSIVINPQFAHIPLRYKQRETSIHEKPQVDQLRRLTLQQEPYLTSTALTPSQNDLLNPLLDRFAHVLARPSTIDDATLSYLESHTEYYWRNRQNALIPSYNLVGYVIDHLQKIITFLEYSLLPQIHIRLCSLASWTSQLIGELLLDMGQYEQAIRFHKNSIIAAREAYDPVLEAIAWGRTSLAYIYSDEIEEAFSYIQQARLLSVKNAASPIRAWLAAIEAEIQAGLTNADACRKSLDDATQIENNDSSSEDRYLVSFDRSLLAGYQGACFRRLYNPEKAESKIFLMQAQHALQSALASLDAALIQRQSTFLVDLAETYLLQGEIEEACTRAIQATSAASPLKLQKVMLRLFKLRQALEPWNTTKYVKALSAHLALFPPPVTSI